MKRWTLVLAPLAVLTTQPACLFMTKPKQPYEAPADSEAGREARQNAYREEVRTKQLDDIKSLAAVANPAAAGSVDPKNAGTQIGPTLVWLDGRNPSHVLTVKLSSFASDTLCMIFHSLHEATTDKQTGFADDVHKDYRLYAPDTLRHFEGAPSITAARVKQLSFDARLVQSTYRIDQEYEVCFDNVSRVLKPASTYALVELQADYRYVWKF